MRFEVAFVLAAALLEVSGDALLRVGVHTHALWGRLLLLTAGGLALVAYGFAVNAPAWDFGRLLGVYVAAFFVVSQIVNAVAFGRAPTPGNLLGGALIAAGGFIVARWG